MFDIVCHAESQAGAAGDPFTAEVPEQGAPTPWRLRVLFITFATVAQLLDYASDALVSYALAVVARQADVFFLSMYVLLGAVMMVALIRTSWLGVRRIRALGIWCHAS